MIKIHNIFLIIVISHQVYAELSEEVSTTINHVTNMETSNMFVIDFDNCKNRGKQFQWIEGKCYHFHKTMRSIKYAQEQCKRVFRPWTPIGPNMYSGKLFEPISMDIFEQVNASARKIFGPGLYGDPAKVEIWTGFKKTDNSGKNIVHLSTGKKAQIDPWISNGRVNDKFQYNIRFFVRGSNVWHDGDSWWTRYSICESITPTQITTTISTTITSKITTKQQKWFRRKPTTKAYA